MKKIRLQYIEFDEEKNKKIIQKPTMKKKRKCYYDGYYNSDKADVESDSSDYNDNNNESKNEEIKVRKKKNIKIKKNLK